MTSEAHDSAYNQATDTQPWCSAVISTPELLESILLQLDLRTLLTSGQLVSRLWRQLIQNSRPLQRALFMSPVEPKKNVNGATEDHSERQYNPLLETSFPAWFHKAMSDEPTTDMPWAKTSLTVFLRPEASWRRMLVCQPPAYTLGTVHISAVQWFYSQKVRVRKLNSGVRMDDLFNICVSWEEPTFQVHWAEHMQEIDTQWRVFSQEIWPQVERAINEAHILIFLRSASDCFYEEVASPYDDIVKFVERFKPLTPYNDDDGWVKINQGLVD